MQENKIEEAGPFSYGAKKPKKGSVTYNAMVKRIEQEKGKKPIEPKDQMVGVAKVGEIKEESDSVSAVYKKLAVKHLKDSTNKNSTQTQKMYAKKMVDRALEASKMDNHKDALNHYRGFSEELEEANSDTHPYMWKIEGGSGKGKPFAHKDTSVDDHLSAMKYHSQEYQKAMKEKRDSDARHHGMKYHKHKDQIERLGDVGNYRKEEVELDEENLHRVIGQVYSDDDQKWYRQSYTTRAKSREHAVQKAKEQFGKRGQKFKNVEHDAEIHEELELDEAFGKERSAAWHADGGANDEGHAPSKMREVHNVYINGRHWKRFSTPHEAKRAGDAVKKKYPDKSVSVHKTYMEEIEHSDMSLSEANEYLELFSEELPSLLSLVSEAKKKDDDEDDKDNGEDEAEERDPADYEEKGEQKIEYRADRKADKLGRKRPQSFKIHSGEDDGKGRITQESVEEPVEEELKGKQHKLDKNKNGKLDAHDFKLLRKEVIDEAKIPVEVAAKAVHKVLGQNSAVNFLTHLRAGTEKHTSWDKVNDALVKQGVKPQHIATISTHVKPAQYQESKKYTFQDLLNRLSR